jgi:hypothetical protein
VHALEQDVMNEICTLFPELDPETGAGYGPAARQTLRQYEASLLSAPVTSAPEGEVA